MATDPLALRKLDLTTMVNGLRRAWDRMGKPADVVKALEERRNSRLLSGITAGLTLLAAAGVLFGLLPGERPGSTLISWIVMTAVASAAYGISRTRHYVWAAVVAVCSVIVFPMVLTFLNGGRDHGTVVVSLVWSLAALPLAALLFRRRGIAITTASITVGLSVTAFLVPAVTATTVFTLLGLTVLCTVFLVAGQWQRDLLETDRQASLINSNLELQRLSTLLEKRVTEFARDLVLAAEVGRTVSQVRDLDILLAGATELIRDRFNLYYVQVYLADDNENNLVLRTGTGAVGKELVSRGHRLLIGPGSINGLAAANRQPVVVPDTGASAIFRPNRLLPDTRSELSVPLLVGQRVVGALDLQNNRPGTFTQESLPPFATLASQLAIAIENAALFTEISQARAELETQMAKQTGESWRGFLDAIRRGHWSGFAFEEGNTQALQEPLPEKASDETLTLPFTVAGVPLGAVQLDGGRSRVWTEADTELVSLVALEAARRVENLRLLAEAEQYRSEAEDAARRLVRKGWEEFLGSPAAAAPGYRYDQREISRASHVPDDASLPAMQQALTIGDVSVGRLAVSDTTVDETVAAQLMATVAHQLSAHMENLRLSEQTEKALSATERQAHRLALLNSMSGELSRAPDIASMYSVAVTQVAGIFAADNVALRMVRPPGDTVELMAIHGEAVDSRLGDLTSIEALPGIAETIRERRAIMAAENQGEDSDGIQSQLIAPLVGETHVIGVITVSSRNVNAYAPADESLILQIGAILGAIIERRILAEQAQARAERERILREITAKVSGSADVDTVMRTAVTEIGKALGRRAFVYLNQGAPGTQATDAEDGM